MRSARAFIASIGASTCLVLAGTLAMALISTVVAFSGMPGGNAKNESPAAILAAAKPITEDVDDTGAPVALILKPALARRAAAKADADRRRRPAPVAGTRAPRKSPAAKAGSKGSRKSPASADTEIPVSTPGTGTTPGTTASGVPLPAGAPDVASVPKTVAGAGKSVGAAVKGATDGVAKAVKPVAPAVAPVIEQTGTVAADTVDKATSTAADAIKGITGGP